MKIKVKYYDANATLRIWRVSNYCSHRNLIMHAQSGHRSLNNATILPLH